MKAAISIFFIYTTLISWFSSSTTSYWGISFASAAMVTSSPLTVPLATATTMTVAAANRLVITRRIKKCKSVQEALDILDKECCSHANHPPDENLDDNNDEDVFAQAISICGKYKDPQSAIKLMKRIPNSDLCRARVISICGAHGKVDDALCLIAEKPLSTSGPYNAAIAACGNQNNWEGILTVLEGMPKTVVTSLTINAVLTGLSKNRRGTQALDILNSAESKWNVKPDRVSYHNTLSALLRDNQLEEACRVVLKMKESGRPDLSPNKETYNRIASAISGKERARATVVGILGENLGSGSAEAQPGEFAEFQKWSIIPRKGEGKTTYWTIGHVVMEGEKDPIIVGLQPNRNPAANGMKLCFYRKALPRDQKLGYLLMINSANASGGPSSKFLGQFVDGDERGKGWAKVWLAVWLQLCLEAEIRPHTGKMHKPLLCLVLQYSFGMIPKGGGMDTELSPGKQPGHVILYCSTRSLEGAFSPMDRRKQNILISSVPMKPRGRPVVVSTSFVSPEISATMDKVSAVLKSNWKIIDGVDKDGIRKILLGK